MELGLIWWLISKLRSSKINELVGGLGRARPIGCGGLSRFELILGQGSRLLGVIDFRGEDLLG